MERELLKKEEALELLSSDVEMMQTREEVLNQKLQEEVSRIGSLQKDLEMQKKLLDNTLEQVNNEHIKKYQEIEKEH